MNKVSAVEKAYRQYGPGSKEHVAALKRYEMKTYGCYVSSLTTKGV